MAPLLPAFDSVHFYLTELTSRIIAETSIPTDRYHLGKVILQSLKDAPDFVLQIDAATCQSETFRSVLERSVKCATSLKRMGFGPGDVMVIIAPNHLEVSIAMYAALYLGIKVATVDAGLGLYELKGLFQVNQANLVICQDEKVPLIREATESVGLNTEIITFDEGKQNKTFSNILEEAKDVDVDKFKPNDLDPAETIAFLICTSGTTGLPKVASLTHKNMIISVSYIWVNFSKFPTPIRLCFMVSPLQWLSSIFFYLFSPIVRYARVQTSAVLTPDRFVEIVNKYRPSYIGASPTLMTSMLKPGVREKMDLSCFEHILIGGSAVQQQLFEQIKKEIPNVTMFTCYGCTEVGGFIFIDQNRVQGSVGVPLGSFDYRLVNVDTNEDIKEPNVNGELWVRGPAVFKGYYNNPELTKEVLQDDGWWKTGDILYRDENYNFFFVDRLKLLLKYKSFQISPTEIEAIIYQHPGVLHVAVTGIPDDECGDLPVACVVRKPGQSVTAQEIKDLVKDILSESKQLRGGVVFMKELPLTVTSKINRTELKEIVKTIERE